MKVKRKMKLLLLSLFEDGKVGGIEVSFTSCEGVKVGGNEVSFTLCEGVKVGGDEVSFTLFEGEKGEYRLSFTFI